MIVVETVGSNGLAGKNWKRLAHALWASAEARGGES